MAIVKFHMFEAIVEASSIDVVKNTISQLTGLYDDDFYLVCNGKQLNEKQLLTGNTIHVMLRTLGGKGGFGSMLRAIGAQIEKTTNREACRDLSGRRLRDINEEKRLKNWISHKEEREREAREKRRQRLERQCQEPKVKLKDEVFIKQRLELTENVSDSVEQGLKASCSGVVTKRKCEENKPAKRHRGMLLDEEFDSGEDVSSADEGCPEDTTNEPAVKSKSELPKEHS